MSENINYINVGKLLYDYVDKKSSSIADIKLHNREAWSVVKIRVYYQLLHESLSKKNPKYSTDDSSNPYLKILRHATHSLIFFFKFFILALTKSRKNLVWFMPLSCDKLMKSEDGKNLNVLIDKIIESDPKLNYIYFEYPSNYNYKDPSYIKRDLGTLGLTIPTKIIYLLIKYWGFHTKKALLLTDSLNTFFKEMKVNCSVAPSEIKHYLDNFSSEYCLYKFLLLFIKPKSVFVVDQGADGKIGAFLNEKIKVLEVQHGMLGEYDPHYVNPSGISKKKENLVIADKVCVFGEFHAKVLLKCEYWNEQDIVCLGNYRIDYWRQQLSQRSGDDLTILFPTQWHTFEESKEFFDSLLADCPANVKINLKLHPGEREAHILYYQQLQTRYPDKVVFWDKTKDIYELTVISDLVIGFDSTTLLEALSLRKPCLTISTTEAPMGIHNYLFSNELVDVIKVVKNADEVKKYIDLIRRDKNFKDQWITQASRLGEYLYSPDYTKRCFNVLTNLVKSEV